MDLGYVLLGLKIRIQNYSVLYSNPKR